MKPSQKVFLAPMEEVNDIAFRLLCKKAGCELAWTGLSSPLNPKELDLQDKPVLQIFAKSTKGIKAFMKKYDKKVYAWDFNLGCPAKLAKKHGFGSYLEDLEVIEKILKIMRGSTKKPLFVKIRKSSLAYEVLKIAEKYCDMIGIHPRTRAQGYSGEPDLKWAKEFKKQAKIPVIYSGNVNEKNYKSFLKEFDYVMVGREAIGRPEIFAKISGSKHFERSFKDYLKLAKKYNLPFKQIKFQAMQFTKGQRNSRKLREKLIYVKTVEEIESLL
ncbi:MAG: tRNA-dihydrouridine synthase family protein [Nanoarchaeota archaeon]|nr:tRNA-dihydrouridine synthase family protein [Nanoarchaeota archaeon]